MITSIELMNWKTHRSTRLEFQKGVNVLIGVMGAGKSSVMDAIAFGLFGTYPALNSNRVKRENIISNRPVQEQEGEVKLNFTANGDTYTVARRISRDKPTTARLDKNGNFFQAQPERVNEEIEHALKIDYDTFSRAVYAEQNRLDYFLELTKGERKQQIDRMLGLDNFAKAEENVTSLINRIKDMISADEGTIAQIDAEGLKRQLEKLAEDKNLLEREQASLNKNLLDYKARVEEMTKQISELKIKHEKKKKLANEVLELKSRMKTLEAELAKIDIKEVDDVALENSVAKVTTERDKLEKDVFKLREEERAIMKSLANIDVSINNNRAKVQEREKILQGLKGKTVDGIEEELKTHNAALQELMKSSASLKSRKSDALEWIKELEKHISKCPVCERELTGEMIDKLLKDKNGAITAIDAEIDSSSKELDRLSKSISELGTEQSRIKLASAKIDEYKGIEILIERAMEEQNAEKAKHDKALASLEGKTKELDALKDELTKLRASKEKIDRKKSYESEIRQSRDLLRQRELDLELLDVDDKAIYSMQEQLTKESNAMTETSSKISGNSRLIASMDSQIAEKAKSISNLNLLKDRIEVRRNQINNMNKFKAALVSTEEMLRSKLITSINGLMQNIWIGMYPYADYSGIRLNAKKDDYLLEASTGSDINNERVWVGVDSIASGGERSTACLTMRIAMAMVIVPNLKWLILDEPTHNIDDAGIGKFVEILGDALPKVVEQIFIITHDQALKHITSARVYQLDRNKDRSEPTAVLEL
ncbi:MAG: SMC family ATPase [Candidatus Micrarchaeota archaeon]|nr:SMC family ATPase [Candidatus Micrarchaeota archaeon]